MKFDDLLPSRGMGRGEAQQEGFIDQAAVRRPQAPQRGAARLGKRTSEPEGDRISLRTTQSDNCNCSRERSAREGEDGVAAHPESSSAAQTNHCPSPT